MPAVVKTRAAEGLELQEVPVPEVGPNDVRIRVQKASICGTDVTFITGTLGRRRRSRSRS
jgi:threonine 3-dehydrogenase